MAKSSRTPGNASRTKERDHFLERVAERITKYRRLREMTQQDLASAARLSLDAINKIEGGARFPNLGTLFDLAHALKIDVADLVEDDRARRGDVEQLARFLGHQPKPVLDTVAACAKAIASMTLQLGL